MVDKDKYLSYYLIDRGRDLVSQFKLGKYLHQIGVVLDGNMLFFSYFNYFFSNKPLSLGSYDWGFLPVWFISTTGLPR